MLTKDQKKQLVENLVKQLKESESIVFVGYEGLKASFVANERKHVSIDRQYSSLDNAATTMNTD